MGTLGKAEREILPKVSLPWQPMIRHYKHPFDVFQRNLAEVVLALAILLLSKALQKKVTDSCFFSLS